MFEQFGKSKKTEVGEEGALYNIVRLNPGDILGRLRASVEESSGTRVQVGTSVLAAITCLQSDLPHRLNTFNRVWNLWRPRRIELQNLDQDLHRMVPADRVLLVSGVAPCWW